MKLITEHFDNLEVFFENTDGKKTYFVEGIYMQADTKNRNNRIYESKILFPATEKYVEEQVMKNRAVGELNHPEGPGINLDKVSHKIIKLEIHGSDVIGKAQILTTPMGKIVEGLLDGGVQLGVSSRGLGALTRTKGIDYVNKYMLSAIDIVQDPSAHGAFVNGIMEGAEFIYDAVNDTYSLEKIAEKLKNKKINESVAIDQFFKLMNDISSDIK